jgi:tyrosyl-tRNA synthetase
MQSYDIITNNIPTVIEHDHLKTKLSSIDPITIYWGISMNDIPNIDYLYNIIKIRDFLLCGIKVVILLADLHAYLQSKKKNWGIIENKCKYYTELIVQVLKLMNVDISNLFFVKGSKFQLSIDYTIKYYDLLNRVTIEDAADSVKDISIPSEPNMVSRLIYPILQLTDEYYLKVDAEYGDYKQEKIFNLGHKINKNKNNKLTYLIGQKLNSFDISLFDDENTIIQKIKKVYFPKNDDNNDLLKYIKYVVFPIKNNIQIKTLYSSEIYDLYNYERLHSLFVNKTIKTIDIKQIVINFLIEFLCPIKNIK